MAVDPARRPLGIALAVALAWSSAPLLASLLARVVRPDTTGRIDHSATDPPATGGATEATLAVVVRVGDEPPEIARATLALAAETGPTVLVAVGREVPASLSDAADHTVSAGSTGEALHDAAQRVGSDALLVVSGRAVPDAAACRRAATALARGGADWIVGRSRPLNRDLYVPDRYELVGERLRDRWRRRGLDTWEPDATIVTRGLLAEHTLDPGRSWGSWLRDRRTEGHRGTWTDEILTLRAAPVAAASFWPDSVARQRARVADLSSAARTGPFPARLAAALSTLRELYAVPLVIWLLVPVWMSDGLPYPWPPALCVAAVVAAVVLRWVGLRVGLGVRPRPGPDVIAAVHHAPASLASVVTAVTCRVRPVRHPVPTRPLVWAALALTLLAGYGLVDHRPGETGSRLAVASSIVMLGALWAFTIRSIVQRDWSRTSHRVPISVPVTVGGAPMRTVDGSPTGVAVRASLPDDDLHPGDEVEVCIDLDDGDGAGGSGPVVVPAVVAVRRRRGGADLLGLELHAGDAELEAWSRALLRAARTGPVAAPRDLPHQDTADVALSVDDARSTAGLLADRLAVGAAVTATLVVVAALVVVLLGYRPLVVRSGSMEPTLPVGTIVVADRVPASELEPGDIVSLDRYDPIGESLTHRVRSVTDVPGGLQVETRGDANSTSETWTVAPDELVGRVVWSVPWLGVPATRVRTELAAGLVGLVVLAGVVTLVLSGRRDRDGPSGAPTTGPGPDPVSGSAGGSPSV